MKASGRELDKTRSELDIYAVKRKRVVNLVFTTLFLASVYVI